jgi:hypothetical protein
MASLAIVEDFDVVEDVLPSLRPRLPGGAIDELSFQGGKEALHWGIVPTVSPATHAALDAMAGQLGSVGGACVLAAPQE